MSREQYSRVPSCMLTEPSSPLPPSPPSLLSSPRFTDKVNSLIPEDEALNPGALWVVVATLSGSIFARNRNILLRLALPPAIFFTALPTFLPKLSENLSNEISGQTLRIAPELHAQVAELRKSVRDSTASVRETYGSSVATVKTHVLSGVESIEDKTGLQLRQAFREAQKQSSPASAVSQATKEVVDPSAGQIAIGSTPSRQVTVPLYGQHAERQVIPGTNAQVASTAADSRPTEVLAVPVHTQVGGSSRTVQERADSLAAEGLAKLEREAERALGKVEEKAGEAKAMAERKAAEVKEAAKDSLSAAKEIVQEKAGEVKEAANTPVVAPAPPQDKGVVTPTGIFADRPTGYKKFV